MIHLLSFRATTVTRVADCCHGNGSQRSASFNDNTAAVSGHFSDDVVTFDACDTTGIYASPLLEQPCCNITRNCSERIVSSRFPWRPRAK